jgi:hypothetical protein
VLQHGAGSCDCICPLAYLSTCQEYSFEKVNKKEQANQINKKVHRSGITIK